MWCIITDNGQSGTAFVTWEELIKGLHSWLSQERKVTIWFDPSMSYLAEIFKARRTGAITQEG